jgi:hypothetical protein
MDKSDGGLDMKKKKEMVNAVTATEGLSDLDIESRSFDVGPYTVLVAGNLATKRLFGLVGRGTVQSILNDYIKLKSLPDLNKDVRHSEFPPLKAAEEIAKTLLQLKGHRWIDDKTRVDLTRQIYDTVVHKNPVYRAAQALRKQKGGNPNYAIDYLVHMLVKKLARARGKSPLIAGFLNEQKPLIAEQKKKVVDARGRDWSWEKVQRIVSRKKKNRREIKNVCLVVDLLNAAPECSIQVYKGLWSPPVMSATYKAEVCFENNYLSGFKPTLG